MRPRILETLVPAAQGAGVVGSEADGLADRQADLSPKVRMLLDFLVESLAQ